MSTKLHIGHLYLWLMELRCSADTKLQWKIIFIEDRLHRACGMLTVKEKESVGHGFSRKQCPPKVHAMTRCRRPQLHGHGSREWYLEFDKMCNATVIMTALFVYPHARCTPLSLSWQPGASQELAGASQQKGEGCNSILMQIVWSSN